MEFSIQGRYVLIDFEHTQPKSLDILTKHPTKVLVFVGSKQNVPFDFAEGLQPLGDDAKYIRIAGNGRNALDFHIAFYVGELAAQDPDGQFYIVSKDLGFDPLISHLKARNPGRIRISRLKELDGISGRPVPKSQSKVNTILKHLVAQSKNRPGKIQTLQNTIAHLFANQLPAQEIETLVAELETCGHISVAAGKISYTLSKH